MERILIAAGGTAGHVVPALAVADELRARGADVTFAGTPDRVEASLVPAAGYPFDAFRVAGLPRRPSLALARAAALDVRAPLACLAILRRRRPQAVLGAGGFVAGPMLAAARTLRIPGVLTESDSHLGLANRLALPLVRRAFLAFPLEGHGGERFRVVGRPVPRRFFTTGRDDARRELDLPSDAFVLAAIGAFAGARRLNEACVEAYGAGQLDGVVVHQSGARDLDDVRRRVSAPPERYRLFAATDRLDRVLAAADLCVARAGGSVFELAAAGVPAILVPYPYATAGHQRRNAEVFAADGGAVVVDDAQLTGERLRAEVDALRREAGRLAAMRTAMHGLARPDAAGAIADELLRLARGGA